jgi:two-component system, NarL family, sensor histidine kinase BarA
MKIRRTAKLKTRILLLSLFPTAVVTLVLAVYVINAQLDTLEQSFTDRGNAIAEQFAAISIYGIYSGNSDALLLGSSNIYDQDDVVSISLVDNNGNLLLFKKKSNNIKQHASGKDSRKTRIFSADISYDVSSSSISDYPEQSNLASDDDNVVRLGTAYIEMVSSSTLADQKVIIRNSLLLVIFGLVVSGVIANLTSQRVVAPVLQLTKAVIRMKHGDYSARVPTISQGEVRTLEDGFNSMASELENAHEHLQQKVDQATSDLTQTLEELEIQNVELVLARKSEQQASKVKSEFLANMSHEIRTPMNAVIGFTNLLLKTSLSSEQKGMLQTVSRSATDLLGIINNILDYSKLESDKLQPEHNLFDVRDCFENPLLLLAPAAHDKHLELVMLYYSDVPPQLIGDELRIRQILMNLVGNAIKFTSEGEIIIRVMVDECDDAGNIILKFSVTDTGIGICDKVKESLFKSFHQADSSTSRKYGGSGLGLSISQKLAHAMGGEISVSSNDDKGSVFSVTLTLTKTQNDIVSNADYSPLSEIKCILLDNHRLSRLASYHFLTSLGMSVTDGVLDDTGICNNNDADLIVLGFAATEIDEKKIIGLITSLTSNEDIPILVLISSSDHDILNLIESSTRAVCLPKPFASHIFERTIYEEIDREIVHMPRDKKIVQQDKPNYKLQGYRILVADDNPINLELITIVLRQLGAEISQATDGNEAVELACTEYFDLILMDIHMPNLSGLEAAKEIRDHESKKSRLTPIIALTADVMPETKQQVEASGMVDYLIKPVNENTLIEVLTHHATGSLKSSRSEQQQTYGPLETPTPNQVRDIQQAIDVAGGKPELAQQLYAIFCSELPEYHKSIQRLATLREWDELREVTHRLQGSSSVCAVFSLNEVVKEIETAAINKQEDNIDELLSKLDKEVGLILS